MNNIVVVGAGGHAKVIVDILSCGRNLSLVDKDATPRRIRDACVVGDDSQLEILRQTHQSAFIALGINKLRQKLFLRCENLGFDMINACSPYAVIRSEINLSCGVAVMAGAVIQPSVTVGRFAIVNTNASIDHDCQLGDGSHIGPGSVLAGDVRVGRLATLGAGVVVLPGVEIGENAVIGAGSVVVRDIPGNVVAYGSPATVRRSLSAA